MTARVGSSVHVHWLCQTEVSQTERSLLGIPERATTRTGRIQEGLITTLRRRFFRKAPALRPASLTFTMTFGHCFICVFRHTAEVKSTVEKFDS